MADDGRAQLSAIARDASGAPVPNAPAPVWTTSSSKIATVNGQGVVAAHRPGSVTITATIDGRSGGASVTVR